MTGCVRNVRLITESSVQTSPNVGRRGGVVGDGLTDSPVSGLGRCGARNFGFCHDLRIDVWHTYADPDVGAQGSTEYGEGPQVRDRRTNCGRAGEAYLAPVTLRDDR